MKAIFLMDLAVNLAVDNDKILDLAGPAPLEHLNGLVQLCRGVALEVLHVGLDQVHCPPRASCRPDALLQPLHLSLELGGDLGVEELGDILPEDLRRDLGDRVVVVQPNVQVDHHLSVGVLISKVREDEQGHSRVDALKERIRPAVRHKRVDVLQDLNLGHGGADQEVLRHLQAALVKVWPRAEHDGDVPSPPKGLHELRE
mmetsp:Transcript_497/g.1974  ORF Transcript_497/g.1974 Transcript_497/m.1974 type:complete len:201 (-) Transcript_497:1092-1694(-)